MSGSANSAISFSQIANNARVPLFHVEFDNSQASESVVNPRSVIMGIPSVTMPSSPIYIPSTTWSDGAFGPASPLAASIRAYLANDPGGQLYALPVAPTGSPTAATGSFVITGTATSANTIGIYIGGTQIQVDVNIGDAALNIANNAKNAIDSLPNPERLPISISGSAGTITCTAAVPGAQGNDIDLRVNYGGPAAGEGLPSGITIAVTPMSGGTGIPVLANVASVLGSNNWDFIHNPFTDSTSLTSMATMMSFSTGRWSDLNQSYGHVWGANSATVSDLIQFGVALNDPHGTYFGLYNSPTSQWEQGAAYMGTAAQALRADPARTVQTLTVTGVLPPAEADQFSQSNRQAMLTNGVATVVPQQDGTIQLERAVTTYQFNKFGAPDQSYLDTESLYSLMFITRDLKSFVTQQFPRCKLAADGTPAGPGSNVVTPKAVKAALVLRYSQLVNEGQAQNVAAFSAGLVVQLNGLDPNRLDVLYDPVLMGNLRIFAALNQFRLAA